MDHRSREEALEGEVVLSEQVDLGEKQSHGRSL